MTTANHSNVNTLQSLFSDIVCIKDITQNNAYPDSLNASLIAMFHSFDTNEQLFNPEAYVNVFKPLYEKGIVILQKLLFLGKYNWKIKDPDKFKNLLLKSLVNREYEKGFFQEILLEGFFYFTLGYSTHIGDLIIFWYAAVFHLEEKMFGKTTNQIMTYEKTAAIELCKWILDNFHDHGIHTLNITKVVFSPMFGDNTLPPFIPEFIIHETTEGVRFEMLKPVSDRTIVDYFFPIILCEAFLDQFVWNMHITWGYLRSDKLMNIDPVSLHSLYILNKHFPYPFEKDYELQTKILIMEKFVGGCYASPELNSAIDKNTKLVNETIKKRKGYPSYDMKVFIEENLFLVYRICMDVKDILGAGTEAIKEKLEKGGYPFSENATIISKLTEKLLKIQSYPEKKDDAIQAAIMNIFLLDKFHQKTNQDILAKMISNLKKAKPFRKMISKK